MRERIPGRDTVEILEEATVETLGKDTVKILGEATVETLGQDTTFIAE